MSRVLDQSGRELTTEQIRRKGFSVIMGLGAIRCFFCKRKILQSGRPCNRKRQEGELICRGWFLWKEE